MKIILSHDEITKAIEEYMMTHIFDSRIVEVNDISAANGDYQDLIAFDEAVVDVSFEEPQS